MNGRLLKSIIKEVPTIEEISFKILLEAYNNICRDALYSLDWEEEQFTTHIMSYMKKTDLSVKFNLVISTEPRLIDDNFLPIDDNNPKTAPRIDLSISSWKFAKDKEIKYFLEAKNLCSKNWKKTSGTIVNASYYKNRYITTGIENFRIDRYYNGSIIGYVLQGEITEIVDALNKKLLKDENIIKYINNVLLIKNFLHSYESIHLTPSKEHISIKHIFLKF